MADRRRYPLRSVPLLMACCVAMVGCTGGPALLPEDKRTLVDRALIERPIGLDVTLFASGLTAPIAIVFGGEEGTFARSILIAEGGLDGSEPRIVGFRPDGTRFDVYPAEHNPFVNNPLGRLFNAKSRIFGPIGGMALRGDELFVSHRDHAGRGLISAFDIEGKRRTVVADLPASGDFGVTDLAFHPTNGRLTFAIGAATNSGVVGLDNWDAGWVRKHPDFSDVPAVELKLVGARFDTPNPAGGLLGGDDIAVTAPFQPFGSKDNRLRVPPSPTGKPTAAVYSISPGGGDLRIEAHGIRYAKGLAFNDYGILFVTNQGMEMRGTRPIQDDPDAVLRIPPGGGTWFGWPDYSADLVPIQNSRFQPPIGRIRRTGYDAVSFVIDPSGSGLIPPDRGTLVRGVFSSLSGAAKMTFVRDQEGFADLRGNLIVALGGDRFPFATGGAPLAAPVGYKVVRLDPDTKQASDFIYNTAQLPASLSSKSPLALERPVDVKFGPDGAMYIVDMGRVAYRGGKPRISGSTGKVLRIAPQSVATQPTE